MADHLLVIAGTGTTVEIGHHGLNRLYYWSPANIHLYSNLAGAQVGEGARASIHQKSSHCQTAS
jgi:hypothetical protein